MSPASPSACRFGRMPLLAILALLLFAPLAFADAVDDYRAIHNDWERDGKITRCFWTLNQLKHARDVADDNPDDTYNGFPDRVDAEIARWKRGDCTPRPQIAGVRPTDRVRVVNRFPRTVKLGGLRLRDRQGNTIRFPRGMTLPPGGSIFAYSDHRIWDRHGDIARIVNKSGKVVSQYGYGRFKNRKRF
jgi:hypothetical protein